MRDSSIGCSRHAALLLFAAFVPNLAACGPEPADLLLVDARVYTLAWGDPAPDGTPAADAPYAPDRGWRPDAQAVAVRDGRIVFVGDGDEGRRYAGPDTEVLDVAGATVLPGLVDSHTHVAELGALLSRVNLVGVETEEEAVALAVQRANQVPAGTWIVGAGWDEGAWADRYPDMELLSEQVPDHPVYLRGLHGFAGWANRMALEAAGIDGSTEAPVGGEIRKDARGRPTGLVLNRAIELLDDAIPAPTPEQLQDQIVAGLEEMARSGFVTVHEAGVSAEAMEAFTALESQGRLPIRVYAMLSGRDTALLGGWEQTGPDRDADSMLRTRSVKAYYDGALGSRGARLLEDYSDRPGHRGVSGEGYGFDQRWASRMMAAGFQIGIHAIGDAGNRETLDFIESVYRDAPTARANRNRIEHAQVLHSDDFARLAGLDLIASMEPPHAVEDMAWAEDRLGPQRIAGAYAWRTMREVGVPLIFNSDLPGSDWSVFYGLHAAVTRRNKALEPSGGWVPEQSMTPEEALRAYSTWAAFSAFVEAQTGVIEPGRWADLTVITVDPFGLGAENPAGLLDGEVVATVVDGRVVYRKPG
jgi:predicted amidohydrolase YtcJ